MHEYSSVREILRVLIVGPEPTGLAVGWFVMTTRRHPHLETVSLMEGATQLRLMDQIPTR